MATDLGRIKGNVAKMVSQGAPEKDIDDYIAAEGTTVDAIKAFKSDAPPQPTGYDAGLPAQGLSGVYEGAADVLGAPADLVNLGLRAGAAGVHAMGGPDVQFPVEPLGGSQSFQNALGGLIKPPTNDPTSQFVRGTVRNVVAATVPVGGEIAKAAEPARAFAAAVAPAAVGGALGAGAQAVFPDNPYANALGMAAGSIGSVGAAKGIRRVLSPFPISPERAALNATMADNGVDLTAGQQTGNKMLQYAESEMGGGATTQALDNQNKQFTQAVLSKAGVPGNSADTATMKQAFDDIGQTFNDLGARNQVQPDHPMLLDLQNAWQHFSDDTNATTRPPIVEKLIRGILDKGGVGTGQMVPLTGDYYNSTVSEINRAIRGTSVPEVKMALGDVKSALDDAMERTMTANNSPDLGAFQQARRDYKNLLVIQNAAVGGGADAATGMISPARLRQAAVGQNKKAYVTGQGDYSELAHAGQATMTPLPQSGTAPRAVMHTVLPVAGGALGWLAHGGGPEGGAMGTLAGMGANRLAGSALMSPPVQSWLSNQTFAAPINGGRALVGPAVGTLSEALDAQNQGQSTGQVLSSPNGTFEPGAPNQPLHITVNGATPYPAGQVPQ